MAYHYFDRAQITNGNAEEPKEIIVYAAYCNADMTEGRGPMIIDLVFVKEEDAKDYINDQPGVMGRKVKWSNKSYGDWIIRPIIVLNHSVIDKKKKQEQLKENALNKLTREEKAALGL